VVQPAGPVRDDVADAERHEGDYEEDGRDNANNMRTFAHNGCFSIIHVGDVTQGSHTAGGQDTIIDAKPIEKRAHDFYSFLLVSATARHGDSSTECKGVFLTGDKQRRLHERMTATPLATATLLHTGYVTATQLNPAGKY